MSETKVVNIRKAELVKSGYKDFEDWSKSKDHVYIGRNMNVYVKGTLASKWKNPFPVKKYGLEKSLELYEEHIRKSGLVNEVCELKGKTLGCWCKPQKCHGDILVKLIKESCI